MTDCMGELVEAEAEVDIFAEVDLFSGDIAHTRLAGLVPEFLWQGAYRKWRTYRWVRQLYYALPTAEEIDVRAVKAATRDPELRQALLVLTDLITGIVDREAAVRALLDQYEVT